MATTRRGPPAVDIYRDPVDEGVAYDHNSVLEAEAQLLEALRPNPDASSDENCILNPPDSSKAGFSPQKSTRHSSSPPPRIFGESDLNSVSLPPPKQHQFTDSPPKKPMSFPRSSSRPSTAGSRGQQAMFTTFSSAGNIDKENVYPSSIYGDNFPHSSDPSYGLKTQGKRPMMDSAPMKERNAKKQKNSSDEPFILPQPEDMPQVEDDGNKPPYSYAILIGMAILRAPERRLTLAQIYKWISDTFQFYRNAESGWQNSIRHNLSLNKAFIKQERPKENPGKGNYWAIEPGCERQFLKDKSSRRNTTSDSHSFIPEIARPSTAPSMNTFTVKSSQTKSVDSSKFPEETELSSDGTIPLSDPAMHDGYEQENSMPPPATTMRSSPPPEIHSSPPPVAQSAREGTPPALPRLHSSRSGGRKRKFSALGDSGYFSSIESSATRGQPRGPLLTSEADLDRPIIKRGRAEEEIARIRHSSYESPTKSRPPIKQLQAQLPTSSPFRANVVGRGPLTPAVVFKRPAKPPPSVSPNTHLKNHRNRMRQLIGSPQKSAALTDDTPWSPAFRLTEEHHVTPKGDFDIHFDVFDQSPIRFNTGLIDSPYADSPCKKASPSKRPRLMHAFSSSNVLADVTSSRQNSRLQNQAGESQSNTPGFMKPFLRYPNADGASPSKSPTKAPTSHPTTELPDIPFDLPQDDLFGIEFPSDGSEEGLDLQQGFSKIGAESNKPSRPRLGRSSTTLF